jgi:hypothetical protein
MKNYLKQALQRKNAAMKLGMLVMALCLSGVLHAQDESELSLLFSAPVITNRTVIKPHLTPDTKVVYIDKCGDGSFQLCIELTGFHDGLAFIHHTRLGCWGVIDTLGNFLIDFKLRWDPFTSPNNEIPIFQDGVAPLPASNFNMNGIVLMNKKGEVVKNLPDVVHYTNFVNGVACIEKSGIDTKKSSIYQSVYYKKTAYINTKGQEIYPAISFDCSAEKWGIELQEPRAFSDSLLAYYDYIKKRWGYMNMAGKIAIPAQYKNAHDFHEGLAAVENDNEYWGFIDKTGKSVIDFPFSKEPSDFSEGIATVKKRDYKVCMIDKTGQVVYDNMESATAFIDGVSLVRRLSPKPGSGPFEYLLLHRDLKTTEKVEGWNDEYLYYHDGIMYHDNGVIGRDTKYIFTAERFKKPFRNGLAPCLFQDNKKGPNAYINKKGEIVIIFAEPEF